MKIEKLTENKIRIILKQEELKDKSFNFKTLLTQPTLSKGIFFEILEKAKEEIGFETDGYKLLIEAISSYDDIIIFTITKYHNEKNKQNNSNKTSKKHLVVKRKENSIQKSTFITYKFDNFEDYCSFCNAISNLNLSINKFTKSSLYLYNDSYFLVLSKINLEHKSLLQFYNILSEFGKFNSNNSLIENKLKEYGKIIMKSNAILKGIKFFSK